MTPRDRPPAAPALDGRALRLEGVVVRRGPTMLLSGVDLGFRAEHRYVLVGPSGAGKSTLIRLLNRLEDPAEGRVLLGDEPLRALPVRALRRMIAVVPQEPRPLADRVRDNLTYPASIAGQAPPTAAEQAAALEEFGLPSGAIDRDATVLSGGERRRLAIAVALMTGPSLLVLDEPTAGLDPASASRLVAALDRRADRDGLRTIVVSHDRRYAPRLGDRAAVLDRGRVVDEGPTAEVLARADATVWALDGSGVDG